MLLPVMLPVLAMGAGPVELSPDNYSTDLAVLIIQVNWGRAWDCGEFENAQLEALTFTRVQADDAQSETLELRTPSKLLVDNTFLPYAYLVRPGEYVLTGFDVKVARSRMDVRHIIGTRDQLIKDNKPVGGSFTAGPGEIVYVGHFGLDCTEKPFLWRFYVVGREEFERYIDGFREKYPFLKDVPVQYRLFSTEIFGNPYSLENPTID